MLTSFTMQSGSSLKPSTRRTSRGSPTLVKTSTRRAKTATLSIGIRIRITANPVQFAPRNEHADDEFFRSSYNSAWVPPDAPARAAADPRRDVRLRPESGGRRLGAPVDILAAQTARTKVALTRNQIKSFWAAWGGWTMDGMDSFIYSLVLVPALRELLPKSGIEASAGNVGYYGGVFFALFMIGYGVALVWGPIADRFGRVRTMMFSILCFSLFTMLTGFSTGLWTLAIFRFMAGVGIGGEWAVGASLVSEDWPEERRTMGAALMHTGYYIGFFLAGIANIFVGSHYGWRAMFALGGVPALLIGIIRNNVHEPARWESKAQELGAKFTMHRAFLKLFSPQYRRRTIVNSLYLIVSLAGLWAGSVYAAPLMTYIAERSGRTAAESARLASYSTALLGVATVLGALI